jgi:hypothetical protein
MYHEAGFGWKNAPLAGSWCPLRDSNPRPQD